MREVKPPAPNRPAITLPPEASTGEIADFARGTTVLERLAKRTAELVREYGKDNER